MYESSLQNSLNALDKKTTASFALPSMVEKEQLRILPQLHQEYSSSGSSENLEYDVKNISIDSHSTETISCASKKNEWRLNIIKSLATTPIGQLDPNVTPIFIVMNVS